MGSRVDKRKQRIASELKGRELTEDQQAVVDVFTGVKDNQAIELTDKSGKERRVIMRQGNEQGAGTKHSVFGHYGTTRGVITADDVLRIPEVLKSGTAVEKLRGNAHLKEYRLLSEDGTRYTVLTELRGRDEVFNDFYSNKKALHQTPQRPNGDTQQSARTNDADALSGGKITKNSLFDQAEDAKTAESGSERYSLSGYRPTFYSNAERAAEVREVIADPEGFAANARDKEPLFTLARDSAGVLSDRIADGSATAAERAAYPIVAATHAEMRGDRTIDQGTRYSLDTHAGAYGLRYEKDKDGKTHFYKDMGVDGEGKPKLRDENEITEFTPGGSRRGRGAGGAGRIIGFFGISGKKM